MPRYYDEENLIINDFLDLTDTPSTYSGTSGYYAQSTGSGIQWAEVQPPGDYVTESEVNTLISGTVSSGITFLNLNDTPTAYPEVVKSVDITIDHSKIDSTLTNFPLLIKIESALVFSEVGDNYKKIKILAAGNEQCYAEVEYWEASNNSAVLHVRVPSISSSEDTTLQLVYSANLADNDTYIGVVGTTPAQTVWDSDFIAVWNMAQDPSGGSGCIKDSTSNGLHGTPDGSMTSGDLVGGFTGKGIDFDGSNDEINVAYNSVMNTNNYLTVEAFHKPHDFSRDSYSKIVMRGTANPNFDFYIQTGDASGTSDPLYGGTYHPSSPGYSIQLTPSEVPENVYYYSSFTFNSGTMRGFHDGSYVRQASGNSTIPDSTRPMVLGGEYGSSYNDFDGVIDNIRVSKIVRTDAWIKATNYSLRNDLCSYETSETPFAGYLGINVTSTALEFKLFPDYVESFNDLDDVPSTYSGSIGKFAQSTGSGIQWAEVQAAGDYITESEFTVYSGTLQSQIDNISFDTVTSGSAGLMPATTAALDGYAAIVQADGTIDYEALGDVGVGKHIAKMVRAASQSLTSGSSVKILFDAVIFDNCGMTDVVTNNRFNIQRDGVYLLVGTYGSPGLIDDTENLALRIDKNGDILVEASYYSSRTNAYLYNNVMQISNLVAGDYLEFRVKQGSGETENTNTATYLRPTMTVIQLDGVAAGDADLSDYLTRTDFTTYSGTLQNDIDSKASNSHTHDDRYYTESEVNTISGVLQSEIDGKQDSGNYVTDSEFATYSGTHVHDDRYYTESEVDALISSVSGTGGSSSGTTNYSTLGGQGIQSIRVLYKDADEITLKPGHVHINDGSSDTIYTITDELDKQVTSLSTSTWYYVYVDPPESGLTLAAADIEYSTTEAVLNETKRGYYHPTNTDQRCIGVFFSNSSSEVGKFSIEDNNYVFTEDISVSYEWPTSEAAIETLNIPFPEIEIELKVHGRSNGPNGHLYVSQPDGSFVCWAGSSPTSSDYISLVTKALPDSNKQLKFYASAYSFCWYYALRSVHTPELIYTGPTTQLSSSLAQTNFSAYELVAEYNLDDEAIDINLDNIQGDIYDRWVIEFDGKNTGTNTFYLYMRYNGDEAANYSSSLYGVSSLGTANIFEDDTEYAHYLFGSGAGTSIRSINQLFLKSGDVRIVAGRKADESQGYTKVTRWTNTVNEVTSIRIHNATSIDSNVAAGEYTGTIRVYKFKRIYLPDSMDPNKTFLSLTDTPSTYSGTSGKFAQSTGSGIQWAEVQAAGDYITESEFSTYSGTLQTQIDGKQDSGNYVTDSEFATYSGTHVHDDRYYTESEVDALISSVSGTGGSSSGTTNYSTLGGQGIQSIRVLYKDADEITLKPGHVHINDGSSDTIYTITDELDKQVTSLSTSTWYYVYVDPPESGLTLAAADIEYSSTAPTLNETKRGYYHGTNAGWRCIGAFYSDDSGYIYRFYVVGNDVQYATFIIDTANNTPSDTWTDTTLTVPLIGENPSAHVNFRLYRNDTTATGYFRTNGTTGNIHIARVSTSSVYASVTFSKVVCDSTGKIEVRYGDATAANLFYVYTNGYTLPELIYTGPTTQLSSSLAQTNFSAYELVAEYNLNDETLDEIISNVQGDTYDRWLIEYDVGGSTNNVNLDMRFNSDTGSNYQCCVILESNDAATANNEESRTSAQFGFSPSNGYGSGKVDLFLKSGSYRSVIGYTIREITTDATAHGLNYYNMWANTIDEVMSINMYSDYAITGTVRVYRFKRIYLPDTHQAPTGTQTIKVEYKDADELTIGAGVIHINDGTNDLTLQVSKAFDKQVTSLSTSTWYYLYVDPPDSGILLGADDIEYSSTAPTLDEIKKGYYHGTNTDWRCIGWFLSDSSGNINTYDIAGSYVETNGIWWYSGVPTINTSWNTLSSQYYGLPNIEMEVRLTVRIDGTDSDNPGIYLRSAGSNNDSNQYVMRVDATYNPYELNGFTSVYHGSGFEVKGTHTVSLDSFALVIQGYTLPEFIYTGPIAAGNGIVGTPVSDTAYDATTWNNDPAVPTRGAIRDQFESVSSDITTLSGNLQTNIDGKSDTSHSHNDLYYTETEIDNTFTSVSGHLQTQIDNLPTVASGVDGFMPSTENALDGYAAIVQADGTIDYEALGDVGVGKHAVKVVRAASQTVPNNTTTAAEFDTIIFDNANMADVVVNNRVDIKRTGIYIVVGSWGVPALIDDGEFGSIGITINGSEVAAVLNYASSSNSYIYMDIARVFSLNEGDYIGLNFKQNSDESFSTHTSENHRPTLSVVQLDGVAAGDADLSCYLTRNDFTTYSGTLQNDIDTHTHDDRYYTESEVNTISGSLNSKISVANSFVGGIGQQSLKVGWASDSSISISSGMIHINDNGDSFYTVTESFNKSVTGLSTSTWYYVYVDPPTSGYTLSSSDIEYSSTAPTLNETKRGYYHGTNTGWRCAGFFYSDASSNIVGFTFNKGEYIADNSLISSGWESVSTTWTSYTLPAPLGNMDTYVNILGDYVDTNTWVRSRQVGQTSYRELLYVHSDAGHPSTRATISIDDNKQVQFSWASSTNNQYLLSFIGFAVPQEIYTGSANLASPMAESTFKAWEVVGEYEFSSEIADVTISGINGDTDDRWYAEYNLRVETGSAAIYVQFNGDMDNNYSWGHISELNDAVAIVNDESMRSNIPLWGTTSTDDVVGRVHLYLKAGKNRQIDSITSIATATDDAYHYRRAWGRWANADDVVSSIRFYTNQTVAGTIRVYKFKQVALPEAVDRSLLDLTDTPTTYSGTNNKVLMSDGSGVGFVAVASKYLVAEYNLNDETLDATISDIAGDTDDTWEIESSFENTDTSNVSLSLQFNGDTSTNYGRSVFGADSGGDSVSATQSSLSSLMISNTSAGDYESAFCKLFLKSGVNRKITSQRAGTSQAYLEFGSWLNTADEVTTIRVFSNQDITGYVRVYKWSKG
jgi:ribosomal protein S11